MDPTYDIANSLASLFIFGSFLTFIIAIIPIYLILSIWYNVRRTKQNSDLILKLRLKRISMTTGKSIKEVKEDLKRFKQP